MNKPKRNHFNAEMLQCRFTDKEGRLYFYDERFPEKGIQRSTPKNLFVEKYLYTLHLDSGEKDFSGEGKLSRLEGEANKIIEKIVCKARSGKVPYLTSSEKETFDRFFYFQWKRVPDFLNEKLQVAWEALPPEVQEMEIQERKNNPDTMARMRHNIRAIAAVAPSEAIAAVASGEESLKRLVEVEKESLHRLAETGLLVIYAPNDSFIIGSRPIWERRDPEHPTDGDTSDMSLPLASDVAVCLYHSYLSKGQVELAIVERSESIWEINKGIMEQSTVIAGRSHELIASLAGVR